MATLFTPFGKQEIGTSMEMREPEKNTLTQQ